MANTKMKDKTYQVKIKRYFEIDNMQKSVHLPQYFFLPTTKCVLLPK